MAVAYNMFTTETFKTWETGKQNVMDKIKEILQSYDIKSVYAESAVPTELSKALYDIVTAITRDHLGKEDGKQLLEEVILLHPDLPSQLVEVLYLVELELTTEEGSTEKRRLLLQLLKSFDFDLLYRERLEIDTIGDAGIIKNKKHFHTKQIKVRTKMFYKQQKFNLLREESEGYAKLITELNQCILPSVTPESIIQVIRSLIGGFNLDPNRVLDLILEAFECRPDEDSFFIRLLHSFPYEVATITELLAFKILNRKNDSDNKRGVFRVIALLIQHSIIQLSDIYDWVTPDDSCLIDDYNSQLDEAKEMARKANVVSTKDKDKEKEKEQEKEEEERERNDKHNIEMYHSNLKIQLAIASLEVGAWSVFEELSQRFPEKYLVSCYPVTQAFCALLHSILEPLYRKCCGIPARLPTSKIKIVRQEKAPPQCHNFDDFSKTLPLVSCLGPYLYRDPGLMYKILRVGREGLKECVKTPEDVRPDVYYSFLNVLDDALLPSLSMFEANPCIAEELWDTLKLYPYQHRYRLYKKWKHEAYDAYAPLIKNRVLLMKRAKYIMMRVTKETIKPVSRGIGKISHNNPTIVLDYVLKQIQLYDNLIAPVVDSLKYLTSLSYDILGYCIVEVLSQDKDRVASEGMAVSPWLQSLSNFVGLLSKKYLFDMGGILQFVANQLKAEKSIDLLILRDVVQKMGGTDSIEDLKPEQLEAMCGGEILRKEAGQYLQERNTKKSSLRLKDTLVENDLAIPLVILMAQQRASIIYNQKESPHLKLVGRLYDDCQDTLVQFGSFLMQMMTIEELSSKLPPLNSLLSDYHLGADVSFFLTRPYLNHLVKLRFDEMRHKDKNACKKQLYIDICDEVLEPFKMSIRPHYGSKIWEDMDVSFFFTFWTLTVSDLEVPSHIYQKEIKKLNDQLINTAGKRKKDVERLTSLKEKLEEEERKQKEHVERVLARLECEKHKWFMLRSVRSPKNDTVMAFLQLCLFPRCTFTALDAVFCAKFVKLLHSLKTPNFSTLICYDRMFCDITYTVASCTEQEAHRYAKFLLGTLDTVMVWHSSSQIFLSECDKYPGFVTKFRVSKLESNDYVDYENYRHVVHKWHYKITKALVTCLESGDFIQVRNAIFVLQGILPRFPVIINLAAVIEKRIEKVKSEEKNRRKDLYILAHSYSGRLRAKRSSLLYESDFHIVKKAEKESPAQAPNGPDESTGSKAGSSVKVEANGEVNGDAGAKEEDGKDGKKAVAIRLSKDKKEPDVKSGDHDGERKKDKKSDDGIKGKDVKRTKEAVEEEGSNANNPEPSTNEITGDSRSSKKRKMEPVTKNVKEATKKSKSNSRSRSRESDKPISPVRKEKREQKRSLPQEEVEVSSKKLHRENKEKVNGLAQKKNAETREVQKKVTAPGNSGRKIKRNKRRE